MKIAVTSQGKTLNDNVDSRFGRCVYFLVVDTDTQEFEAVENRAEDLSSGAGIQSAQKVVDSKAEVVLTGNCGPKAFRVLGAAGIQVCVGATGTVQEALKAFENGALTSTSGPNVESHAGM